MIEEQETQFRCRGVLVPTPDGSTQIPRYTATTDERKRAAQRNF